MQRETAQVYVGKGADTNEIESAVHVQSTRIHFSRNIEDCWGAGDYTLDLLSSGSGPRAETLFADVARIAGITRVDHVFYESIGGGVRQPGLSDGIWRTLMFKVRAGSDESRVARLEQELLQMPSFMAGIRNWRLGRVTTPNTWTHVWQQEFASVDDLRGEYLMHPFHWAWVDRFFDAEHPEWIVEAISHAACPISSSLLTAGAP